MQLGSARLKITPKISIYLCNFAEPPLRFLILSPGSSGWGMCDSELPGIWESLIYEEHISSEWIIQHKAKWGVANPKYLGLRLSCVKL
jgi:hypothetical protein